MVLARGARAVLTSIHPILTGSLLAHLDAMGQAR